MVKRITLTILSIFLAGCAFKGDIDISHNGTIDAKDKTITVYTGNKDLNGDIKKRLVENGWILKVSTEEEKIEGVVNNKVSLTKYAYKTRYTMELDYYKGDARIHWNGDVEPIYVYELSVFDNKSGNEVISINGKDTQKSAAQSIVNAIESTVR